MRLFVCLPLNLVKDLSHKEGKQPFVVFHRVVCLSDITSGCFFFFHPLMFHVGFNCVGECWLKAVKCPE